MLSGSVLRAENELEDIARKTGHAALAACLERCRSERDGRVILKTQPPSDTIHSLFPGASEIDAAVFQVECDRVLRAGQLAVGPIAAAGPS